jgi:hypothetical protein
MLTPLRGLEIISPDNLPNLDFSTEGLTDDPNSSTYRFQAERNKVEQFCDAIC